MGRCYLKQAKQNQGNIEQSEDYLSEAEKCFDEVSKLVEKSKDKPFKKQVISKLRRDFRELDLQRKLRQLLQIQTRAYPTKIV